MLKRLTVYVPEQFFAVLGTYICKKTLKQKEI